MKQHKHKYTLAFTKAGKYFGKMCVDCEEIVKTGSLSLGEIMDFMDQVGEEIQSDNLVMPERFPEVMWNKPRISGDDVLDMREYAKNYGK